MYGFQFVELSQLTSREVHKRYQGRKELNHLKHNTDSH